jgi:acetyl-CoA carboxylase biotin carboxyl carrier protein
MAQKPAKSSGVETKLIRELAKILNDTDLSEIEMEKGDLKLRVARGGTAVSVAHAAPVVAPAPAANPAPSAAEPAATAISNEDNPDAVKSPMVGTAYTRPSPDKDAFCNVGDSVKEGDTILLIEAMKTFNPIKAPKAGKVKEVLVQDAQAVEFGEALIIIG